MLKGVHNAVVGVWVKNRKRESARGWISYTAALARARSPRQASRMCRRDLLKIIIRIMCPPLRATILLDETNRNRALFRSSFSKVRYREKEEIHPPPPPIDRLVFLEHQHCVFICIRFSIDFLTKNIESIRNYISKWEKKYDSFLINFLAYHIY